MLYKLLHSGFSRYKYAFKDLSISGLRKSVCSECGRSISDLCYSDFNHILEIEGGKEFPDYLEFCDAGPRLCIFSKRTVDIFSQSNISGISKFEPIALGNCDTSISPNGEMLPYYVATIVGRVELNFRSMQLKKKRLCKKCGQFEWNRQRLSPIIVSEDSWDKTDFCRITSMPGHIVCSEEVVKLVKHNQLTGFVFREIGLF